MTPLKIEMLLHWYTTDTDPDIEGSAQHQAWTAFLEDMLIQSRLIGDTAPAEYKLTARGRAYVEALLSVPLPKKTWVVEWPKQSG